MLVWDTQALNMRVVLCSDSGKANSMNTKGYTAQGDRAWEALGGLPGGLGAF